jgi:hypothetical protein
MEFLHKISERLAALTIQEQLALGLAGSAVLILLLMVVWLRRPSDEEPLPASARRSKTDVNEAVVEPLAVAAKPVQAAAAAVALAGARKDELPQDSVLRRHYLAQQEAQRLNRANPYPSDSVLRRHYEHLARS